MRSSERNAEATRRDWFGLDVFRPGPRLLRGGASCYLLEEVASTSDFLLGRGAEATGRACTWDGWGWRAQPLRSLEPLHEPPVGTLVAARRQTGGRGRLGRHWIDCGGLQASMVVPGQHTGLGHGFSVWLGLMIVLTLREDFGVAAELKWPNDLIVEGRKLGGILLDRLVGEGRPRVVAGLGLNLTAGPADFPAELQGRATSLQLATGRAPRPGEVVGAIVRRIDEHLDRFGSEGWGPFREQLAACDHLAGRWVTVSTSSHPDDGDEDRGRGTGFPGIARRGSTGSDVARPGLAGPNITGKVTGIDDHGALILAVGDRERRLRAGEVQVVATPPETRRHPPAKRGRAPASPGDES